MSRNAIRKKNQSSKNPANLCHWGDQQRIFSCCCCCWCRGSPSSGPPSSVSSMRVVPQPHTRSVEYPSVADARHRARKDDEPEREREDGPGGADDAEEARVERLRERERHARIHAL